MRDVMHLKATNTRNMNETGKIFKFQIWHLLSLVALLFAIKLYLSGRPELLKGSFLGISTDIWFWLAVAIPVLHQVYVWLIWRFELYKRTFTKRYGVKPAFTIYSIGFSLLFVSRLISIFFLAYSNQDTLPISPVCSYAVALVITPLVLYLFYSVKKYFTFQRAYGIDHFDKHYREPYVKQGLFKYTDNGMYVFGLMVLYLPGLLLLSEAAILAAVFNHIYI